MKNFLKSMTPLPIKRLIKEILYSSILVRKNLLDIGKHLYSLGFRPSTVIDVGAASGTFDLMNAFPESKFLLIEPLSEHEESLKSLGRTYDVEVVIGAASDTNGNISLNVHPHQLDGSSLLCEEMGEHTDGFRREVPCFRIDNLFEQKSLEGPVYLKIDVQGAELIVLNGCTDILPYIEAVVMEVSLFRFMKGGAVFHEVIDYMKNIGFVAYDIIHGWYRPLDKALGQVDIVFVKEDGFLRVDHRYENR